MTINGCRSEVRQAEGVKIYFDPVSTAAREESARDLAARVLADPARKDSINTVRVPMLPLFQIVVPPHAGAQEPVCNFCKSEAILKMARHDPLPGQVHTCLLTTHPAKG